MKKSDFEHKKSSVSTSKQPVPFGTPVVPNSVTFTGLDPKYSLFLRRYFGSVGKTDFLQQAIDDRLAVLGFRCINEDGLLVNLGYRTADEEALLVR